MDTNGASSTCQTQPVASETAVDQPADPSLSSESSSKGQRAEEVTFLRVLLQLEQYVRGAQTLKELHFILANETRRLVMFRQAVVISFWPHTRKSSRIEAVSSLSTLDSNSPFIQWLESLTSTLWKAGGLSDVRTLSESDCPRKVRAQWKQFGFPHVVWVPFLGDANRVLGGLWLAREVPWQEGEKGLLRRFAKTVAHAWWALLASRPPFTKWMWKRRWTWGLLLLAGLAMAMPVHLSVLAPAELIPKDPVIVTAPLEGVIAEVLVQPNTPVKAGDLLIRYEDTVWRNQFDIAEHELAVGLQEYRTVAQEAFVDEETGAQMPVRASAVHLKEVERDYAWERLQEVEVVTPSDGIAVFADRSTLIGKPVAVGERIMEVANPQVYEIQIDVPVEDAIVLKRDAAVEIFFHAQPLKPVQAVISHVSYYAEVLPSKILAYRVKAELSQPSEVLRIGWQGTAKITGQEVSLFFYLFRRPISFLRQTVGL